LAVKRLMGPEYSFMRSPGCVVVRIFGEIWNLQKVHSESSDGSNSEPLGCLVPMVYIINI
jgi:hypothetical protein